MWESYCGRVGERPCSGETPAFGHDASSHEHMWQSDFARKRGAGSRPDPCSRDEKSPAPGPRGGARTCADPATRAAVSSPAHAAPPDCSEDAEPA